MMFRILYWVTEEQTLNGDSRVTGVYTSIPDLIEKGLQHLPGADTSKPVRFSLFKLDCNSGPLGSWTTDLGEGLFEALEKFVKAEDFSEEHAKSLAHAVAELKHIAA